MTTMTRTAWGLESILRDDQVWRSLAACSPDTAEWFWPAGYSGRGGGVKLTADNLAALDLCKSCPVAGDCLEFELTNPSPFAHIAGGRVFEDGKSVQASSVRAPYRSRKPEFAELDPLVAAFVKRREELGWTQHRLARAANVEPATVNQAEAGKRSPALTTMRRLASALGCDLVLVPNER